MKNAYPATKEGAKEIEIQNLKDKKSENKLEAENKIKQRKEWFYDR